MVGWEVGVKIEIEEKESVWKNKGWGWGDALDICSLGGGESRELVGGD